MCGNGGLRAPRFSNSKAMKVTFVKHGMAYGLGYFAGESAELPGDLANDLAEQGVVRLHPKEDAKPAEGREKAISKTEATKQTR